MVFLPRFWACPPLCGGPQVFRWSGAAHLSSPPAACPDPKRGAPPLRGRTKGKQRCPQPTIAIAFPFPRTQPCCQSRLSTCSSPCPLCATSVPPVFSFFPLPTLCFHQLTNCFFLNSPVFNAFCVALCFSKSIPKKENHNDPLGL